MKYLATETELEGVNWKNSNAILVEEAKVALKLFEQGIVREMYFDEEKFAVLILECQSKDEAIEYLNQLPLVQAKMIAFQVKELKPYTGFSRLMERPE